MPKLKKTKLKLNLSKVLRTLPYGKKPRKTFHDRGVAANIVKSRYSTDYLIDFTMDKVEVQQRMSDLFKRRLHDVEEHYGLWGMPTSILSSGGDLSMRSLSKQFQVTPKLADDPGMLYDDLYASLTAHDHLYGEDGGHLEWGVSFVFWERKPKDLQDKPGFCGVASLRHNTRKLKVSEHKNSVIFGDNRLNILPTEHNYDKSRIGEEFSYSGLKFTIEDCPD